MISYLTANWRAVRLASLVLLAIVLVTALIIPNEMWINTFYAGFYVIGSLGIFTFTYVWPFLLCALDRFTLNLGFKVNGDGGARFFLWMSLIFLPLVTIDGLFPLPSPDVLFGVSACLGLIVGCSHSLGRYKERSEQAAHGDAEPSA